MPGEIGSELSDNYTLCTQKYQIFWEMGAARRQSTLFGVALRPTARY